MSGMRFKIAPSVVEISHWLLKNIVNEGDIVIDATAGNGHDTLFLAKLVGDTGKVWAFDIQQPAILQTQRLLDQKGLGHRVNIMHMGHQFIEHFINGSVKAVIFNLGYLPGGQKEIITLPETTIKAFGQSLNLLCPGGIVCLSVYWTHSGGLAERNAVEEFAASLSGKLWDVTKISFPNKNSAPFVLAVQKRLEEINTHESKKTKENSRNY
ncbi:MAG: class I SAM-dependent methyltransferase [Bacillota bacterium]|jgi:hypothetical protein